MSPNEDNELDELTRKKFKSENSDWLGSSQGIVNQQGHLIDQITVVALIIGFILGVVFSSFLHKYLVHPFGW